MSEIYSSICRVMSSVPAISKDRKNQAQNYSFRGIDDIYNSLNELLAENKIFVTSQILAKEREERQTMKGGVLIYTILSIKFTFYASDGSNVSTEVIGEAMDSGDKSSNKAMSTAYKYAFMQVFCIPTEDRKDTEYESHEVASKNSNIDINNDLHDKAWLNATDKEGRLTAKGNEIVKTIINDPSMTMDKIRNKYKVSRKDAEAIEIAVNNEKYPSNYVNPVDGLPF